MTNKPFYRYPGCLAHWQPKGTFFFITIWLNDSIEKSFVYRNSQTREIELLKAKMMIKDPLLFNAEKIKINRAYRNRLEAYLDKHIKESANLQNKEIQEVIERHIEKCDGKHFWLIEYAILPNHVHLLIKLDQYSGQTLSKAMNQLKGASAFDCNRILNRTGNHFWAKDYLDTWLREPEVFMKVLDYIKSHKGATENAHKPLLST